MGGDHRDDDIVFNFLDLLNLHPFGNAEGHVIGCVLAKAVAGIIRIPVLAGYGKIVAAAFIGDRLLSHVFSG